MNKKCYRFFGGMINSQERWFNKMAANGYRLVRTEKVLYEFEECKDNTYEYRIDFIGEKSKEDSFNYKAFLEDLGYKVYYKNINLNYSVGKARVRPWANNGGKIATNSSTFNKELLIVEKEKDGKPFELYTTIDDKIKYFQTLRNPFLLILVLFSVFAVVMKSIVFGIFGIVFLIPTLIYQIEIMKLNKESKLLES